MSHFPSQITVQYILYYNSCFSVLLFVQYNVFFSTEKFYWVLKCAYKKGTTNCNKVTAQGVKSSHDRPGQAL